MRPTTSEERLLLELDCERFLYREASLLDAHRLEDWFDLLTDDVTYRVPVRSTRDWGAAGEFSSETFHMKEDKGSIRARIDQLTSEFAWSEDPPSRTRRVVANTRLAEVDDPDVRVHSSLVFLRNEDDATAPTVISGERQDTLRRVDDAWNLAARTVYLDHTVVGTESFGTFL